MSAPPSRGSFCLATVVAAAVLATAGAAAAGGLYASRSAALAATDRELGAQASALAGEISNAGGAGGAGGADGASEARETLAAYRALHPGTRAAAWHEGASFAVGDPVPAGGSADAARTVAGERVVVRGASEAGEGVRVALAAPLDPEGVRATAAARWLLGLAAAAALISWAAASLTRAAARRAADRAVKDALAQSKIRQAELVSNASHELKTPLTSMRTNVELVVQLFRQDRLDQVPENERLELERDVLGQMEELSALISDFADMGREDAPGDVWEEFRLDEVLAEALERAQRRRKDVSFIFRVDPWVMRGDRDAMVRGPLNIIDNAAKWSPRDGTVGITLTATPSGAVLLVDDSGPGIPPAERERIFERFYRSTEARSTPGSGLGLAIAKQVLDRHGCQVAVGESPDGGTRFRVVFPGHAPAEVKRAGSRRVRRRVPGHRHGA